MLTLAYANIFLEFDQGIVLNYCMSTRLSRKLKQLIYVDRKLKRQIRSEDKLTSSISDTSLGQTAQQNIRQMHITTIK